MHNAFYRTRLQTTWRFTLLLLAINPEANCEVITPTYSKSVTVEVVTDGDASGKKGQLVFPEFDSRLGRLVGGELNIHSTRDAYFSVSAPYIVPQGTNVSFDLKEFYFAEEGYGENIDYSISRTFYSCPLEAALCELRQNSNIKLLSQDNQKLITFTDLPGGPINYEFNYTWNVPQVTGTVTFATLAGLTYKYEPKTRDEYIADAISPYLSSGDLTDKQISDRAWDDIIRLRETSAETSTYNTELRDAEYCLRGYSGGRYWLGKEGDIDYSDPINELGNAYSPIIVAARNGIKFILNIFKVTLTELPPSPPGGNESNQECFFQGINGIRIRDLIPVSPPPSPIFPLSQLSTDPLNPLIFSNPKMFKFDGVNIAASLIFLNNLIPGEIYYFDPAYSKYYSYSVFDNKFSSLVVPSGQGFTDFLISFGDHKIPWSVDRVFDFTSYAQGGVDAFLVSGFNSDESFNDLNIGVGFTNSSSNTVMFNFREVAQKLPVTIDIKPGDDRNCLNINEHGVIPVAIMGSKELDVSTIKTETLSFAGLKVRVRGKQNPLCSFEYSNTDEFLDMVCHFEDNPDNWSAGSGDQAELTGELINGTQFEGRDSICVTPPSGQ